ncbi:hypothetical protein [Cellulomonas chitinilytica]|nr:hypothetical protein [Cellulomonas chitinilytica]
MGDRVVGALLGFCIGEHLAGVSAAKHRPPFARPSSPRTGHVAVGPLGREHLRSAVAVANALSAGPGEYEPDAAARAVGLLDDGDVGTLVAHSLPFALCITTRSGNRPVDMVDGAWLSASIQQGFAPRRRASERAVARVAVRAVAYRINGDDVDGRGDSRYVDGLEHPGYATALWWAGEAGPLPDDQGDAALRYLASPAEVRVDPRSVDEPLLRILAEATRLARSLDVSEHSWSDRVDGAHPVAAALAGALVGARVGARRLPDLARSLDLAPAAWVCAQLLTGAGHDPVLMSAWASR